MFGVEGESFQGKGARWEMSTGGENCWAGNIIWL